MPSEAESRRIRIRHAICTLIASLFLAACVSAPVQQMSDARQAIQSAIEAGAPRLAPGPLQEAERLVEEAEAALAAHAYERARLLAETARQKAIAAREASLRLRHEMENPE